MRRGTKAVGKTHFLELSSLLYRAPNIGLARLLCDKSRFPNPTPCFPLPLPIFRHRANDFSLDVGIFLVQFQHSPEAPVLLP